MTNATNNATVLIVDDSPLCRDMVGKTLRAHGLNILTATDGFDGLSKLGQHRVDAVILDNEMPKMDGMAFLKNLRGERRWKSLPVFMLTTCVAKDLILEATKYGLSGYLLKSRLSMPEVLERVRKVLEKPSTPPLQAKAVRLDQLVIPNLLSRESTLAAVAQIDGTRTLSGVVSQLIVAAGSPKTCTAEIAGIIRQDPILCARILQVAGSAAYAGSKIRAGSVEDAIRAVGLSGIQNIASTMTILSAFSPNRADGLELLRCWPHALSVASIMSRIIPKTDSAPAGLPYMIGLCHDLVEILLRQKFPSEFAAASDFARQAQVPPTELVKQVFGVPYFELVDSLFQQLKLPPAITNPIKEYHATPRATIDAYSNPLARALAIANFLAHGILCTPSVDNVVAPILNSECIPALIPTGPLNLAEILSESVTTVCLLAGAAPEQEAALMQPILPRSEFKIWYFRHPSFAALDPLEAAFNSLCRVECRDRMPIGEELAGVRAFTIVGPSTSSAVSDACRIRSSAGRTIPIFVFNRVPATAPSNPLPGVHELKYPISLQHLMGHLSAIA